jgi:hypothetical protein
MSARVYTMLAPGTLSFHLRPAAAPDRSADDKYVNQHGERRGERNGYPSRASSALLDKGQKAHLCILAREAFMVVHSREPRHQDELTAWRQAEQLAACGLGSLTAADQRHLASLEAHFLNLKGESGRAFQKLMAPELGKQRQALAVLERETLAAGLAFPAYPAAICRTQYKCTLEEASPKQLWRLVFTVKNRRKRNAGGARSVVPAGRSVNQHGHDRARPSTGDDNAPF